MQKYRRHHGLPVSTETVVNLQRRGLSGIRGESQDDSGKVLSSLILYRASLALLIVHNIKIYPTEATLSSDLIMFFSKLFQFSFAMFLDNKLVYKICFLSLSDSERFDLTSGVHGNYLIRARAKGTPSWL